MGERGKGLIGAIGREIGGKNPHGPGNPIRAVPALNEIFQIE